jgi:hypothetical protein
MVAPGAFIPSSDAREPSVLQAPFVGAVQGSFGERSGVLNLVNIVKSTWRKGVQNPAKVQNPAFRPVFRQGGQFGAERRFVPAATGQLVEQAREQDAFGKQVAVRPFDATWNDSRDSMQPSLFLQPSLLDNQVRAGLTGQRLQPCNGMHTYNNGKEDAFCTWKDQLNGFHHVCVSFETRSMLSGRQEVGCIDAWTWADAVTRDSLKTQGLMLLCDQTNAQLRDLFQQAVPKWPFNHVPAFSKAQAALDKVDELCGPGSKSR